MSDQQSAAHRRPLLAGTPVNSNASNSSDPFVPISIMAHTGGTVDDSVDYALDDDEEFGENSSVGEFVDPTADIPNETVWEKRRRYLSYYVPVSVWLPRYDRAKLIPDLLAGLSIGAMLIPQSMAYAGILGIPPIYGLITGIFPQILYFVFGHSPVLTCGPESTTTMLLVESIKEMTHIVQAHKAGLDTSNMIMEAAAAVTLLAGVFTLLLGFLRLGFVEGVFSRTILAAFVTAAGLLLLLDQTPKLLGVTACADCHTTWDKLEYFGKAIFVKGDIHGLTAGIGIACVVFMLLFKVLKQKMPKNVLLSRIPHIFVMVMILTGVSLIFDLKKKGVSTLAAKSTPFPAPKLPYYSSVTGFTSYLRVAIVVSILGFVETNLIHKITDNKGALISPNRELVALGLCHTVVAFFSGWTPFGSLTRTKVAIQVGAQSQITSLVAFVMICLTAAVGMPFFGYLPGCVTAAILFVVALSLLEFHEFMFCVQMKDYVEATLFIIMVGITFFMGVDIGLFFAFGCCVLLVIKYQNKPAVRLLGRVCSNGNASSNVEIVNGGASVQSDRYYEYDNNTNMSQQSLEGILIYQIDGPLFFSNSEGLRSRTKRIEMQGSVRSHPSEPIRPLDLRSIIFDMTAVTFIDTSAANVLLEVLQDYQKREVRVIFVKVRKTLGVQLENSGILELLGQENVLSCIDAAVKSVQDVNGSKAYSTFLA